MCAYFGWRTFLFCEVNSVAFLRRIEEKQIIHKIEIIEMHRPFAKYCNYAEVGRQIGRSGSTVSKYVQMKGVPQSIRIAVQNLSLQE